VKAEIPVFVLGNLYRSDSMSFKEHTLPWLLPADGLWGRQQRHQMAVPEHGDPVAVIVLHTLKMRSTAQKWQPSLYRKNCISGDNAGGILTVEACDEKAD
jgi:hypothetical protein